MPPMSLADKLAALTTPTPNGGAPIAARRGAPQYPRGWEPGIKYDPFGSMTVTTPTVEPLTGDEAAWKGMVEGLGLTVPEGWRVRLVEAKYDPAAWHRDTPGEDAVTRPVWRYRFSVEVDSASAAARDIDDLIRTVKASRGKSPVRAALDTEQAFVVAIGDTQVGKYDGGGPEATVGRVMASIEGQVARLKELRKVGRQLGPVYLLWLGDCIEGSVSQGGANMWRTPMPITEQVRVVRRLMLHQVEAFRGLSDRIVLASIPGNHDEAVRIAGKGVTRYDDSWAVEAAVQVGDALAMNPAAYGHVSIATPATDELTIVLDIAGTTVGLAHGHQMRAGKAADWWAKQAHGMQPIGDATLLLMGHLHHLHIEQGGAKTVVQVPAMEGESTWWKHRAGQVAPSGAVTLTVGAGGWSDLQVV